MSGAATYVGMLICAYMKGEEGGSDFIIFLYLQCLFEWPVS